MGSRLNWVSGITRVELVDGRGYSSDDDLDTGVSNHCATYGNKQLSSSEFFKCLNIEVWELELNACDI
jgi:hypothetical protein